MFKRFPQFMDWDFRIALSTATKCEVSVIHYIVGLLELKCNIIVSMNGPRRY